MAGSWSCATGRTAPKPTTCSALTCRSHPTVSTAPPLPRHIQPPVGHVMGSGEDKWLEQATLSVRGDARGRQGWGLVFPEVGSWPLWCGAGGRAHSHAARTMQTSRGPRPGAVVSRLQPPAGEAGGRRGVWRAMDPGTHWALSFFPPPQESGSAPGTSATSTAPSGCPPGVFPGSSHYGSIPQMLCKVCQTLESGDVVMTSGWPLLSERLGSGGAPDKLKLR